MPAQRTRIEKNTMDNIHVPFDKYWGHQAARVAKKVHKESKTLKQAAVEL
jgi:fumarate hydratase class II